MRRSRVVLLAAALASTVFGPPAARADHNRGWHALPFRPEPQPPNDATYFLVPNRGFAEDVRRAFPEPSDCNHDWNSGMVDFGAPVAGVPAVWLPITVDLSAYADKAVAIMWVFKTEDWRYNRHEGVFVDEIRIGPLKRSVIPERTHFENGADDATERGRMLTGNTRGVTPGWHATQRRALEGGSAWWFGNEQSGTYEGQPDPSPGNTDHPPAGQDPGEEDDACNDVASSGFLMTPVIKLGANATLTFQTLFSVESVHPEGGFDLFSMHIAVDTDEDGLLDTWEIDGVDTNGDFQSDMLLPGANPDHKDIYVELDCMPGTFCPLPGVVDQVQDAFSTIPVENPDRQPGIMLHVDDTGRVPDEPTLDFDANFDGVKEAGFDARRACCYHYGVWAHWIPGLPGSRILGTAEIGGNDFIIGLPLGHFPPPTVEEQAEIFMHELGHNLGLRHGGGDDINFKPHYFSVMNYRYAYHTLAPFPGGPLRFSREHMGLLNEADLDEFIGVPEGARLPGRNMTYDCPSGSERTVRVDQRGISWRCELSNEDGTIGHAEALIGDSVVLMFDARKGWPETPAFLRLYVDDCDAVYRQALTAGARSVTKPVTLFFGDRVGRVRDPLGNIWWIQTHVEDVDPRELDKRAADKEHLEAMQYAQDSLISELSSRK